jgi:hypothetical protein
MLAKTAIDDTVAPPALRSTTMTPGASREWSVKVTSFC